MDDSPETVDIGLSDPIDPNVPRREGSYDPGLIEARRQAAWRARDAFRTPRMDDGRPRRYIKPSAPFTSGNIHMGHVRDYSIGDAYARFLRARGYAVLFAFGFDAFGLPAELGAIASGESPAEWVARCAEHMVGQLDRLGFSLDWERSFMSSDEQMYRWSQWLFLTLLERDLIYQGSGRVDWCDTCQTTLATLQVEDGRCWRCHNPVRLIQIPQWYLRLNAYLPENDLRMAELEASGIWDGVALASQHFVLGRLDGAELDLERPDGRSLTVFTPHVDALAEARFVLISPRHPHVEEWALQPDILDELEDLRSGGWQRSDRDAREIPLVDTGLTLPVPFLETPLPVLISPTVDGRFGATAVFGIPSQDKTDELIAERLGLDSAGEPPEELAAAAPASARPAVRYRAGDFSISRQRSWGTPIPIVHCEACGTVPVPREQLPLRLPLDLRPTGQGNPLEERPDFVETTCPSCGGPARRETDTLDGHFDSFWLWIPACVPPEERDATLEQIFALPELREWLPSERLVAGSDSGNFVFDQRIITKALRDIGPLAFLTDGEPFAGALFHEMVLRDGRKMSKHLGNVVDPDELTAKFGADTVRLAILYAAGPQRSLNWSDSAVQYCNRFLRQFWSYSQARFAAAAESKDDRPDGGHDTAKLRTTLAKWCGTAVSRTTADMENLEMHKAVRDVMRLFERIRDFEKRVLARNGALAAADREALVEALVLAAAMLAPLAPHAAEELWLASGRGSPDRDPPWPEPSVEPDRMPLLASPAPGEPLTAGR
jgi:leucyl-tRNA synthetase